MSNLFFEGTTIFKEGDKGDGFYDIQSGTVGIFANYGTESEKKLTEIKAGHIFGEMAIIDDSPRSATAIALTDVDAARIDAENIEAYFAENPDRVTFIISELDERIVRLSKDYGEVIDALKATYLKDVAKEPGIFDKIKTFANQYSMMKKAEAVSAESQKAVIYENAGQGFAKTVDTYMKGDVIFKEGEPGHCMYSVQTGWVNIYTGYGTPEEKLINTMGVGTFFGEIGLVSDSPRTATAVADMNQCMVESFTLSDLTEMQEKDPLKVRVIVKHLADRIRVLTAQYVDACRVAYEISQEYEGPADTTACAEKVKAYLKGK